MFSGRIGMEDISGGIAEMRMTGEGLTQDEEE